MRRTLGLVTTLIMSLNYRLGDYFKWASADDLCKPEHLERCLDVLENDDGVVLAYPKTRFIDGNGKTLDINDRRLGHAF